MKIGILQIGQINSNIIQRIQENIRINFPKTKCITITEKLPIPEEAFDKTRNQYFSGNTLHYGKTWKNVQYFVQ